MKRTYPREARIQQLASRVDMTDFGMREAVKRRAVKVVGRIAAIGVDPTLVKFAYRNIFIAKY